MSWVIYDFSHMFICFLWFCHELPKGEIVRTYVIHLLRTYVTILCNWPILWQNALYLYLGKSRMCLILQETLFQDQVLKSCKSVQDLSWKCKFINARQLAIYWAWRTVPAPWLDISSTDRVSVEIYENKEFHICFDSNLWLCVWAFFSHNPRHIKGLF